MRGRWMGLVLILFLSSTVFSQGLFENAEGSKDQEQAFELNGYLRSTLYLGKVPEGSQNEIKSGYGEFSLKLKASKERWGSAFAEVRFRKGYEFSDYVTEFNIREAYVSAYLGPFDFRIGHQIVAWGRADGINPTDNITPKNMLVRSPDEDDKREANFLLRTFFNAHPVRIELIWVPFFRSSVVPTNLIPFPPAISLGDPDYPEAKLKNGAVAAKMNLELAAFDFSISYFNGHSPFPGLSYSFPDPLLPAMDIFLKSFRVNVLGADFSTTVRGFGLRGEAAYTIPHEDPEYHVHIPNPNLHYVLGVDKEFSGGFSIIFQYIGRTVIDFTPLVAPPVFIPIPPVYELELKNRIITSQQFETSHSFSCRLGWNLLHETLNLEVVGLTNVTTEEFLIRPRMAYDIADAFTFTLGGEFYSGPVDTLFDFIEDHLSSVFVEFKISF